MAHNFHLRLRVTLGNFAGEFQRPKCARRIEGYVRSYNKDFRLPDSLDDLSLNLVSGVLVNYALTTTVNNEEMKL
jgi:hypothetical protein